MTTRTFTEREGVGVANPYESEVPAYCEDPPCEWTARQGEFQGQFVKTLLQVRNTAEPGHETAFDTIVVEGGRPPEDLDGDGYYDTVDDDPEKTYNDVVALFENYDDEAVTEHYEAYDRSDNDQLDYDDLVELFRSIGG